MDKNVIVFDIGGTWFRSGIYTKGGELICVSRQPAKNYKKTAFKTMQELQGKLVTYIKEEVARLRKAFPQGNLSHIAISMGAALNAHTGYIFNSGPLWGPNCLPFDLHSKLTEVIPGMYISIINDVSAALLREVTQAKNKSFSKIMLITVSTGIACRIFEVQKGAIPVDKVYGLQGEIGHIPIRFTYNHKDIALRCDCGEENHLNAFCSGRGIEKVLQSVGKQETSFSDFIQAVLKGDAFAISILHAVTKPLAELLLVTFTFDPETEKVIFTGGVTHALGKHYMQSLLHQLNETGMYQITNQDPKFFEKRLFLGKDDDKSSLIGAALSFKYKL